MKHAIKKPLRILTLTYPLIPLRRDACGGAEQVAWNLLRSLPELDPGLELTTCAAAGSRVPGKLLLCFDERPNALMNEGNIQEALAAAWAMADAWARGHDFDLVHIHGPLEMAGWALSWGRPVIFTLHMARELYPAVWDNASLKPVHFVCVSQWQQKTWRETMSALAWPAPDCAANGIAVDDFDWQRRKQAYWLYLGRICPEKAPHLAMDLARSMNRRLILAGGVYPFPSHEEYFHRQIRPRLDSERTLVPCPGWKRKRDLLSQAAAVVVTSQTAEPSSLIAMEAAASGTPVLALARGALAEIVRDGVTGILGNDLDELRQRSGELARINPARCRRHAEQNFQARRMAEEYWRVYRKQAGPRETESIMRKLTRLDSA